MGFGSIPVCSMDLRVRLPVDRPVDGRAAIYAGIAAGILATLVHFALSVAYGLILSRLISRLRARASLLAGAAFGLCLYAVNMYGFTSVFPWFNASRDWITAATHVAFGMSGAGAYRVIAQQKLSSNRNNRRVTGPTQPRR
jgi:hypothetical protein